MFELEREIFIYVKDNADGEILNKYPSTHFTIKAQRSSLVTPLQKKLFKDKLFIVYC